jgi:hypothetical protein
MGSVKMYLFTGSRNVQTYFNGTSGLNFRSHIIIAALGALGMPPRDIEKLKEDDEGGRIFGRLKDIHHSILLRGESVSWLVDKWSDELLVNFDSPRGFPSASPLDKGWVVRPIYQFLRDQMVMATAMTFAGPRFVEEWPTISQDIWDFDDVIFMLAFGAPRFLCRRGWDARARGLGATRRWLARAREDFDCRDRDNDAVEWEENFGHRLIRERYVALEDCGVSLDGRASLALGLFIA